MRAARVLRERKEELQRYIRALEYRDHGVQLGPKGYHNVRVLVPPHFGVVAKNCLE